MPVSVAVKSGRKLLIAIEVAKVPSNVGTEPLVPYTPASVTAVMRVPILPAVPNCTSK
jgi:hypothetical protein